MEEKHHDFSPSKLDRIKICPASWKMEQGLEEKPSPFAEEGTLLHERTATNNLEGLTDEQQAAVGSCIEFRGKLYKEYIARTGAEAKIYNELKVAFHDKDGNVLTEGTADVVIVSEGARFAVVSDWKYGFTPVKEVSYNLQLAAYAAGVMEKFSVDEVECHVFQPRIFLHSSYNFSKREAIISNIAAIIAAAKRDTMVLNPTEDSCRYCKARLACPAFRFTFQNRQAVGKEAVAMTNDELAEEYARTRVSVAWAKEIEERLKAVIEDEGKCGRYGFKVSEGSRQIKDINACYEKLKELLTIGEFNSVCSLTVGKLETLVAGKLKAHAEATGGKMTLADAKKAASEIYADLITRGTPSKSVVEIDG